LRPSTFCDANVLYPSLLRDVLIRLAITGLCELRWSERVQDEWSRALIRNGRSNEAALIRTRDLMGRALPNANVTDYEHLIPDLNLPDPDDRHVLAAAIHSQAGCLITFNLKDFPAQATVGSGVSVQHPDTWTLAVLQQDPSQAQDVILRLLRATQKPSLTLGQLGDALNRLHMPQVADFVSHLG